VQVGADDQVRPVAQHRELLASHVADGRPQPPGVLQADGGQHRHAGVEDVGGVVAPAQAGLDDGHLDLAAGQLVQPRRGEGLELGDAVVGLIQGAVDLLRRAPGAVQCGGEVLGCGVCVLDADALGEGDQVGGQVGARAQPLGHQHAGQQPGRRRLAVGPHHVDGREVLLWGAQHGEQPADAVQPEAHAEQLEAQ
jgi:hypothetical protein